MKVYSLVNVLAILCSSVILLTGGLASEQTSQLPESGVLAAGNAKRIDITGTYIPFRIKRVGRITNGPDNLIVIDRAQIESSGAAGVAEVLAKEPGIRVIRR